MRGRKPEPVKLKPKDVSQLRRLSRDGHNSQRMARCVRILLARVQAERTQQVASKTEQHRTTICRVCERYRQAGLTTALYDAPRSG